MTIRGHGALLIAVPVAFAGLLWLHPMVGDYEGLQDVTTPFQVVHVAMVLVLCLLALGIYDLLDGLRGRAATVARGSLIPFVAFYVPYVAFEGVALGVLGQELNGLPAAQRDAVASDLVADFATNPILGEPGVFWALGSIAWLVVIVATVFAFRRAGASRPLLIALGACALIAAHAPPLAPIGWLCFAAAGSIVLRGRGLARTVTRPRRDRRGRLAPSLRSSPETTFPAPSPVARPHG